MLADSKTLNAVSNRNLFTREGYLTERDQREDSAAQDISARYRKCVKDLTKRRNVGKCLQNETSKNNFNFLEAFTR